MERPAIDPRHLRSAVEFAVLMAEQAQKAKLPLKFPERLRRQFGVERIPTSALSGLATAIEGDEEFRTKVAVGALPELVDEVGRLWLTRPDGWQGEIANLVEARDAEAEASDAAKELKRAEKRRRAAEEVAVRARAELVVQQGRVVDRDHVIEGLRSDVVKLAERVDELQAELVDTRLEARHARDREAAALMRLATAESARDEAVAARGSAESVRDDVLADRAAIAAERSELTRLAATAESLAAQLAALAAPSAARPKALVRKALPMPGGVMGDSDTAAEYLMRSGASVLVDGYNVAKLAWPKLDLAGQRVVLLDAVENLARRYGSDVTVVFDGADVVGAKADQRRVVRVMYSPDGIIADDVIRDEVRRLPATRPVVVVTNDRQIVGDARAMGANTMSSDQFVALIK